MKSIVDGNEIPDNECWIWTPENYHTNKIWLDYEILEDCQVHHNHPCVKCGTRPPEVFLLRLPDSHGYVDLCRDCLIDISNFIYPSKNRCPQCQFGHWVSHFGGGEQLYMCLWNHVWQDNDGTPEMRPDIDNLIGYLGPSQNKGSDEKCSI